MRDIILLLTILIAFPSAGNAADKKKDPGSQIVCRASEVTGSRVQSSRTCKSRAQWEADKMRAEQDMIEMGQKGLQQDTNVRNPDRVGSSPPS
jgi:hypothetical protein